jgi:parallel beta-helix repeat protein
MGRKVIAIWLSLIMMVSVVVIVDVTVDISLNVGGTTLYVNTTGSGGAYTKIQDAINDSKDGDTVYVYNGTYFENVVVNKSINLTGEDRDNTIIDGGGSGDVVYVNASWVNITGFTVTGTGPIAGDAGIELNNVNNCKIINNHISSNNEKGLFLFGSSSNNKITNNVVSNNDEGIHLFGFGSNNNIITDNTVSLNFWTGIYIQAPYNIITNNNVSNNRYGIRIGNNNDNNITNNNVHSNQWAGIYLYLASNNNIINNNVESNSGYGINISSSSNNRIYHNNITNNTNQAYDDTINGNQWDDGYPSGGNYWSDYSGFDNYKGPKQNILGNDDIGDTPYDQIEGSNAQDNYPLMQSYKPPENVMILNQGWNLISLPYIQVEQNLTRVLGTIDGYYDAVQWYDNTNPNDLWKHHKVLKQFGNDLFELNETMGFWIHITQPGDTTFLFNGTQSASNQTITLYPGWNMVGYPSLTSYNRTQGLNNLTFEIEVDEIQLYNATTQTWHVMNENDHFEPCRGYWIHDNVECEWEVPL